MKYAFQQLKLADADISSTCLPKPYINYYEFIPNYNSQLMIIRMQFKKNQLREYKELKTC